MKIKVSKESVVVQGPAFEDTIWGVCQFPHLAFDNEGNVCCNIHMADDVWEDMGVGKDVWFTSKDGGKTWGEVTPTGISGSPPHLMLHSSGALILTYGRREAPFGERIMISRDGGKTWGEEHILTEAYCNDLGYPATVELEDGSLVTVYYERYKDDKFTSILGVKWRIEEFE